MSFPVRIATGIRSAAIAAGVLLHARAAGAVANTGLEQAADAAGLRSQNTADFVTLLGNIIGAVLGLLGVVFIVLVIYAGFLYMTAGGEADKIKQAKSIVINAVIGLVLIFAAYAISGFVFTAIGRSTGIS